MAALMVLVALWTACTSAEQPATPRSTSASPSSYNNVSRHSLHEHLQAFQRIAEAANGTRAAGTPGHIASVEYAAAILNDAGYEVEKQSFLFPFFEQLGVSRLRIAAGEIFTEGVDFRPMIYSASGTFEATVYAVDFDSSAVERAGPGCDPDALAEVPRDSIVLVRPGPCLFREQAINAQAAGASAVIFSLPEWSRQTGVLRPTLLSPDGIDIPVFAANDEVGMTLERSAGEPVRVDVRTLIEQRRTTNLVAESGFGDPEDTVVVGGHLDSVMDGPGINDNASGAAALLAVGERLARSDHDRRLRVVLWSGEEYGLLGSTHYVQQLADGELDRIHAYLNFDMLGSRNAVNYVYAAGGNEESERIHELFEAHFDRAGLPHADIDLEGRSDHGPFLRAGVPVGGLFSGAEMLKSPREAKRFGGQADSPMDRCYHRECDDLTNVDENFLDQMAEAIFVVVREMVG